MFWHFHCVEHSSGRIKAIGCHNKNIDSNYYFLIFFLFIILLFFLRVPTSNLRAMLLRSSLSLFLSRASSPSTISVKKLTNQKKWLLFFTSTTACTCTLQQQNTISSCQDFEHLIIPIAGRLPVCFFLTHCCGHIIKNEGNITPLVIILSRRGYSSR